MMYPKIIISLLAREHPIQTEERFKKVLDIQEGQKSAKLLALIVHSACVSNQGYQTTWIFHA